MTTRQDEETLNDAIQEGFRTLGVRRTTQVLLAWVACSKLLVATPGANGDGDGDECDCETKRECDCKTMYERE